VYQTKISAVIIFALATVATLAFQNCAPSVSSDGGSAASASSLIAGNAVGTVIAPYGNGLLTPMNMPINVSDPAYSDGTYHPVTVNGVTYNVYIGTNVSTAQNLSGTSGNDVLMGGSGDDLISAGASDDWIQGGKGNDTINGGNGNDWIYGGQGNDTIYGERGNDTIFGGRGINTLYGANAAYSGTSEDGDDTFVLVLDDAGGNDIANRPQDTVIDRGGYNRVLCRNSDMSSVSGGKAYYENADLIITFGNRGQTRIVDYSTYPFSALDCGYLTVVKHP
jgi:Ca2+-binding RTX toxin-like protein